MGKKVIGIIMTYNCAHLVEDAVKNLPQGVFDDLMITDDGSKDNIENVAKKMSLAFFRHEHGGYGVNLRYGLIKALELEGEFMVEIHGDGQFDQSMVPFAIQKMKEEDLDFVIGSRFTDLRQPLRDGMPLPRYLANIGLSFIERMVLRIPWTEYHTGFRIYRRRFLEKLDLNKGSSDYFYSFEIIAMAAYLGVKCGEVPIRADYHKDHTSVGYAKAAKNSFQEMWMLKLYILDKLGLKTRLRKMLR